ncbi:MAG: hypothetical protein Q7R66_12045 [Undibacterium sp.]|uniref:TIGR04326 family surface carbohydrate biosynthesis protein n=1 Tax=Undibacterium sp. TaxID=1914977 RepID=UPI002720A91E|nr:TIGR04326 family surface carbohydrate biosynthesis protein [Undibacterium sp.]MDO8652910.1 hypothetical protein [Undibacterium sp.]
MTSELTVWARTDRVPHQSDGLVYWQSYGQDCESISVPRYLEAHGEGLREKYLTFIHDLGERQVSGKRLVEHLESGEGLSFWWMTQLAEKSPFKSPRIYDCLRMLALEEILLSKKPSSLILECTDGTLAQSIERLCFNLGIKFSWARNTLVRQKWSLRRVYSIVPYWAQALISIRHLIVKWPRGSVIKPKWFSGSGSIFFCSYFFNLDALSCSKGNFRSRQWEALPTHLQNAGFHTNWIHHRLLGSGSPDVGTGNKWLNRFNRDSKKQGCHSFLESYLTGGIVYRALIRWKCLIRASSQVTEIADLFSPMGSGVWLWPLLRHDWTTSTVGAAGLQNCLWMELFDSIFKDMPHQPLGLYLWENQGWESAMLWAWRKHKHGQIIGVPHATVVFWHLNNFDDSRTLMSKDSSAKPIPDRLAINGQMAWRAFTQTGYPAVRLVPVEALRFQYLLAYESNLSDRHIAAKNFNAETAIVTPLKVLILGDFTFKQTLKMLRCIAEAARLSGIELNLTLKRHPVCRIEKMDCSNLSFEITDQPLGEIMSEFDFAFSSNTTSAGLDALLAGLSVVVFLDEDDLNQSPLRGVKGVRFVDSPQALADEIRSGFAKGSASAINTYFWLDNQLPRWNSLLAGAGVRTVDQ